VYIVFQNIETREIFARNIEQIQQNKGYMKITFNNSVENITVCVGEYHAVYEDCNETYFHCEILRMEPPMVEKVWGKLSICKGDV
jgi:hypothetical protein